MIRVSKIASAHLKSHFSDGGSDRLVKGNSCFELVFVGDGYFAQVMHGL